VRGYSLLQFLLYFLLFYEEIKKRVFWGRIKLRLRSTRLTKSSPITSFEEDSSTLSITVSLSSLNILHYHCFSPAPCPPLELKISCSLLWLLVMVIYCNNPPQRQTQQHYIFFRFHSSHKTVNQT
jgi:hypothetical protein